MKTMTKKWWMVLGVVALVGAACSSTSSGTGDPEKGPIRGLLNAKQVEWETQKSALSVAADCPSALDAFKQMLATGMLLRLEEQRQNYIRWAEEGGMYKGGEMDASMSQDAAAPSEGGDKENGSADEYSDTNVQVAGVDEADMVKTDGNLMFIQSGKEIVVLDAWPAADMAELGRVTLKSTVSGFFRTDDRLVALSYVNRYEFEEPENPDESGKDGYPDYYYGGWYRYEPMTLVTIVDITTPAVPVILDEMLFEGSMISSRRIGNRVYLVQQDWGGLWNNGLQYWPEEDLWNAEEDQINAAFAAVAQKNLDFIDGLTLDDITPWAYKLGADGLIDVAQKETMSACTGLYFPSVFSGTGMLTAVTIDITGDAPLAGSSVLGDWGTLYASANALYIAATNWSWSWWWMDDDGEPDIVTHVHKFAFEGAGGVANYVASGSVIGYVLNQFSLDEYEGILRVATTLPDWGWWSEGENKSESFVTTLQQTGNTLNAVGQVGELGKGETIQSVRFIGDQGYVVTFRQVDPLYVIDLADPTAPAVTGELKIPGFSSYIHPMGDHHLLTIGRDGNDEGQTFGVSFQIFDVSDPANPTQIAKTTLGADDGWNTSLWSDAMWDHHAFVYFASKQKLAIPMSGWSWDESTGHGEYLSYLQLFHVDVDTGVTPYGIISHADLIGELPEVNQEQPWCWYDMSWLLSERVQVKRGVFMDDYIYSISRSAVKVHRLDDLDAGALKHVILQGNEDLQEQLDQYAGYCYWGE